MPLYVYETLPDDGSEPERFEVFQAMADDALTRHPVSGLPVQRVITAPNLPLRHSDAAEKAMRSDANLKRLGFQKLQKDDSGKYVNTL